MEHEVKKTTNIYTHYIYNAIISFLRELTSVIIYQQKSKTRKGQD